MANTSTNASKLDLAATWDDGWADEQAVKGLIESVLQEKCDHNLPVERQAKLNIAWFAGNQNLFWNARVGDVVPQPNPYNRKRLCINLIQGLVAGVVAKLGQDRIQLRTDPATDDIDDYDTAEIQTKVLNYYQRYLQWGRLTDLADLHSILCGETFVQVTWDATLGSEFDIRPQDVGMTDEKFGKKYGDTILKLRQGDLSVDHIPIFNLYWGPDGTQFEDADYVLTIFERSKAYAVEHYDVEPDELTSPYEGEITMYRPIQTSRYGSSSRSGDNDMVLVKCLWVKPFMRIAGLERGRMVVQAGNKIVQNVALPYDHQRIPIVRFVNDLVPDATHGSTFVTEELAPQSDINQAVSQFSENRELMANPVWLASESSIVDENQWNSKPGGMRYVRGAQWPTLIQGASMPNSVFQMILQTYKFMQDIAAMRDVSQGKNPPGVRSGSAIIALKEADDQRMGRTALRRRQDWATVGSLMLQTLAQYVTEDRIVQICGEDNRSETIVFSGDMLTGKNRGLGVRYFDVQVHSDGVPQSMSAKMEKLNSLIQGGFLRPDNPEHAAFVMESLMMDRLRRNPDPTADARQLQRKRNQMMVRGQYTQPKRYEMPAVLIEELHMFQRRAFFDQLPEQIRAMFLQYEKECIKLMALEQMFQQSVVQEAMQSIPAMPQMPGQPPQGALPAPAPPQNSPNKPPESV